MVRGPESRPGEDTPRKQPTSASLPPSGPKGDRIRLHQRRTPHASRSRTLLVGIPRSRLKRVWISVLLGSAAIFSPSQTPARPTGPVAGQSAAGKAGHRISATSALGSRGVGRFVPIWTNEPPAEPER